MRCRRYEKAYDAKVATVGPWHFSVGHTLFNLAGLMLDDDRPSDAVFYFKNALAIYEVRGVQGVQGGFMLIYGP